MLYVADCDECKWSISNEDSTVVRESWKQHVLHEHHRFMIYTLGK